jgi:uncharacterized protein YbcI
MASIHSSTNDRDRSQGEIEAAICDGISRFQQEYMGRGPSRVHTHLVENRVFVHMQGVLTAAEQRLMNAPGGGNERSAEVLKAFRSQLVASGRSLLEAIVREVTGAEPVNVHHDISAVTGEEVIVFTLASPPVYRHRRKRNRTNPNR